MAGNEETVYTFLRWCSGISYWTRGSQPIGVVVAEPEAAEKLHCSMEIGAHPQMSGGARGSPEEKDSVPHHLITRKGNRESIMVTRPAHHMD